MRRYFPWQPFPDTFYQDLPKLGFFSIYKKLSISLKHYVYQNHPYRHKVCCKGQHNQAYHLRLNIVRIF